MPGSGWPLLALILPLTSGCTAFKVASATGSAGVSATTGAVEAAGAVGRSVTPSGKQDDAADD